MRRAIAIILCSTLLYAYRAESQTNTNAQPDSVVLAGVVIVSALVGGYMIYKVWSASSGVLVDITLQESDDAGKTWCDIDETIMLLSSTPQAAFSQQPIKQSARVWFRVKVKVL